MRKTELELEIKQLGEKYDLQLEILNVMDEQNKKILEAQRAEEMRNLDLKMRKVEFSRKEKGVTAGTDAGVWSGDIVAVLSGLTVINDSMVILMDKIGIKTKASN